MRRRSFVVGLSASVASGARAQPRPPGRIGYMHPVSAEPRHVAMRIMSETWRSLGYVDGETVIARGGGGDSARLAPLAQEIAAAGAGVIIAVGAETVVAAVRATTLPVVAIDLETDPVRAGFAQSYNRPGGRVTGVFMDQSSLAGKWIELLLEVAPDLQRVALLWSPTIGRAQPEVASEEAKARGLEAQVVPIDYRGRFEEAIAALDGRRAGLVQLTMPGSTLVNPRLAAAAIAIRMPTVSFLPINAQLGLLMGYGPNQDRMYPRGAVIADQILRGRPPGDIPIERPDRFDLGINLATAKALGIALPSSLLVRADEVYE